MTRSSRARFARPALAAAAALTVTAGVVAAAPDAKKAQATPKLTLIAASKSVNIHTYEGATGLDLNLGTYLTAEGSPWSSRQSASRTRIPSPSSRPSVRGRRSPPRTCRRAW